MADGPGRHASLAGHLSIRLHVRSFLESTVQQQHARTRQIDAQPGSLCRVALQRAYKDVSPCDHGIGAELS